MRYWRPIERAAHWVGAILAALAAVAVLVIVTHPSQKNGAQPTFAGADVQHKKIAVYLDGTWNTVESNTSVWRMRALTAPKTADGKPQLIYYSVGVNGFLGGVVGQGLDDNIRQAYEWLVENYVDGDEIYIFGFSRGAYTARSLAGLIAIDGILKPGSPVGITDLFDRYKANSDVTIWGLKEQAAAGNSDQLNAQDRLLLRYAQPVDIQFVGVWDTVGSIGVSAGNIPGISRQTFSYLQTGLRVHILNGFHALAIDEHRKSFAPTLWDVRHPNDPHAVIAKPRRLDSVEQRWFVGAHANVGGGYPTDLLAQAPLRWMMEKAKAKGLAFRSDVTLDGVALHEPVADSYRDFAYGLYRFVSWWPHYRVIGREAEVRDDGSHLNINETIDPSVFDRWRADPGYRPQNLLEWAKRKQVDPANLTTAVLADDPSKAVPNE